MTTPPYDPNNPPPYPGGSAGGGYPQYPGGPGGNFNNPMPPPPPPNHLAFAIISTVLCCLPLGIASIIFATQVNTKWQQGDFQGAQSASNRAKQFAIWSVVSVVIIYGLLAVLGFMGVFAWEDYI